ncbi:MAG: o-succinylbenzoate synthase [Bacteroidales bacterium]|nr:o-succinylbenzoate synthase [Bacteroidales bacterium]
MLHATFKKRTFHFRKPAGTSRGNLLSKDSYFIILSDDDNPGNQGIGECSLMPGLSPDDRPDLEDKISDICRHMPDSLDESQQSLADWPAVQAGIEMAFTDLENGGSRILYPSGFTAGMASIPTHGLIWMGKPDEMQEQIERRINEGHRVIKMKIGALNFDEELNLIRAMRSYYPAREISIRLDANGAFSPAEALSKLEKLAAFDIHSIEQPIRQGQYKAMADICRHSPIPVALDEELIGVRNPEAKRELLETIRPRHIVLKPSLLGGFMASQEWIELALELKVGWWINSALESNIGLNAIAQWTATLNNTMVQGLGTGSLINNNFPSPLMVKKGNLQYNPHYQWDLSALR